jgi:hypothetical protein
VWDTHPTWPGVYGERYRTALSEAEQAGLKRFLAHQRMHSRYRHLKNIHVFTDPITFAPSAQSTYNGTEKESPNATLSHYLSLLNGRALVQELTQSPAFEQYKYALLGSFSPECGSIASFLPREQRADWMANFDQFSSLTQRANQEQDQRKRLRSLTPDNVTGFAQGDMETLTPLRYLSEHGLRVSTEGWTTALEKNSYDYTAPQPLASMMEVRLFNIMANTEPSLHEFAPQRHLGMNPRYCKYLRQKSQDNFKN